MQQFNAFAEMQSELMQYVRGMDQRMSDLQNKMNETSLQVKSLIEKSI